MRWDRCKRLYNGGSAENTMAPALNPAENPTMRIGSRVSASIETLGSAANRLCTRTSQSDVQMLVRKHVSGRKASALEWERWIYDCEGHAEKYQRSALGMVRGTTAALQGACGRLK